MPPSVIKIMWSFSLSPYVAAYIQGNKNELLIILNEMLALVGLQDLAEFPEANAQQNGKTFEFSFVFMYCEVSCIKVILDFFDFFF